MKKIKYILWLSLVWFWLLNSVFAADYNLYVDWNFITPVTSTISQSSSYLYHFKSMDISAWTKAWLWYELYYDNTTHFSWLPMCVFRRQSWQENFGSLNSAVFNNSILSFSPFNWRRQRTSDSNYVCTANSNYNWPIRYLLWYSDTSLWKNFIYLWNYTTTGSVKYWIWDWFAWSEAWFYDEFSSTENSNYLRIIYRSSVSTNNNPYNTLNPVNLSGSENFNNWDFLWEIHYPRWTRNNYWYVIDDWYYYTKYKHFWGFQLWYSYIFDKFQFVTWMNWDSLWFRTVSDSIEVYQYLNGSLPYSEFSAYNNPTSSSNYNYSWNWILTLKSSSYYSLWNWNWVYLFSKNPNNTQQILYEHWSCELFNIDSMIKWTNNCVKLDWWLLTYNWNTNVLPFEDKISVYDFTTLNSTYPLLYDLFGSSSDSHWFNRLWTNCMYINQNSRCYGFQSDSSVNITEIYLNQSNPGGQPWESYDTNAFFSLYYQCMGPFYNTPDWLPPEFCLDTSWNLIDIENYRNCFLQPSIYSWEKYNHIFCDIWGYQQEMVRTSSWAWGYFSACYWEHCWTSFYVWPDSLSYNSWFSLSTWLIEDMFTNLTGWVWKCPFSYTDFQLWKNNWITRYLKTLGFEYDPFVFINCVVAGFHHWRHTIDNTLFGDTFEHPLLYGDTPKHRTLFVFLDFIVILWLFGLLAFIKKIF